MTNLSSDTRPRISRVQDKDWISHLLLVIRQKLVKDYGVSLDAAIQAVNDSGMKELCQDIPEFVEQYSASHWAKVIYETRIKKRLSLYVV